MTRLRIALLIHDIDACGGMERQASLLARRLAARGHTLQVVCHEHKEVSWGALRCAPPERRAAFVLHKVPLLRGVPAEAAHELALLTAARSLRHDGVDVLLAIHISSAPAARDLGQLLRVPWVVKLAGGGPSGDMAATLRGSRTAPGLAALRRADRVVCVSAQIEEEVRGAGVSPAVLARIPNGVDLASLSGETAVAPQTLGLDPGARPILFVGRLDAGKRVDVLLRALALLLRSRPEVHLLVAGTGPDEVQLRSLAAELGLAERVRFLGQRDDVPGLLKLAGAFVLPSIAEGMSNALLEALAAGTPVVATRIPANEGVVDDGSAWLVPVDDAPALAASLEEALFSLPAARARVARGVHLVRERFDIERVAAAYEALFLDLSRGRGSWAGVLPLLEEQTRHTRAWLRDQAEARLRSTVSAAVVAIKRLAGRGAGRT